MAIKQQRRQKQLARKAAKRRARQEHKRQSQNRNTSFSELLSSMSAGYTVHESMIPANIFEVGIGNLVLSRRAGAQLVVSSFLTDIYCLGVKDAFHRVLLEWEYAEMMQRLQAQFPLTAVHPACLRKLVEGAVAYAQELGIPPHKDYFKARRIFLEIDPDACPMSFQYGRDGKPLYIAGPNDSPAKSERTLRLLEKRCGRDGFHYILPMG